MKFSPQTLEKFALSLLEYEKFPQDHYVFRLFQCHDCSAIPLTLNVEHHTGSSDEEFRGKIFGQCSKCKKISEVFSFTGEHRTREKTITPICDKCNNEILIAGQAERFSGDEAIRGFAEEGAVVAACEKCGEEKKLLSF